MKSVDNLTGRELDRAVAEEVLGHTVETIYGTGDLWIEDVAAKTSHQSMSLYSELPVYSSRIEAAWKVVSDVVERGFGLSVFRFPVISSAGSGVYVILKRGVRPAEFSDLRPNEIEGTYVGHAPTEPLAICRAALKAVRGETEEDDD